MWDTVMQGANDVLALYAGVEKLKLDQGIARSNQQIAEWNAQAPALTMQRFAENEATAFDLENKKVMLIGFGILVLGGLAYMAVK